MAPKNTASPFYPTLNSIRSALPSELRGQDVAEAFDSIGGTIAEINTKLANLKTGVSTVTNQFNTFQQTQASGTQPANTPNGSSFSAITSGDNTQAIMTVDTGSSLTFVGGGIISANEIYNVMVSATPPTTGQTLVYNGTEYAPAFMPQTFTPVTNEYLTGYDAATGLFSAATVIPGITSISGLGIAVATPDPITSTGTITVTGSGTTLVAATATTSVHTAPVGDFIVADGSGNVTDSGISIPTSPPTTGQVLTATSPTTTAWETPGGGSGANAVQVLVDFGSPPSTDMVLTTVSAPWIDADTILVCNVAGVATDEHAVGEGVIEGIRAEVDTITPGVGFILRTVSPFLSFGHYYINCIGVG